MNDREQIWKIVADFTSLTRQSNAAAKAVRNLEEARAKASSVDSNYEAYDKEVASLDKLSASLKEAAKERRANASAIKREKEAEAGLLTGVGRRKQSIDAATTSTRNNTSATTQNTSAVQDNARSLDKSVAAQRYLNLVMQEGVRHKREHAAATRDHTQATHESTRAAGSNSAAWAHNNSVMAQSGNSAKMGTSAMRRMNGENGRLGRSLRQTSASAIGLTGSLSVVNRAITDVGLVSRSWALVMKMLPLTAVTSAVNSLIPAINGLGGAFVGLVGSMGPVLGLLGALPTMAVAAAGAIGGLFAGLGGIFSTFSKWNKMQEAQSKAAIKATNKASTTDKSRAKSVRSTSRQIEKAYKDQAKAKQGIADAEERLRDTFEDSADRVAKAEKVLAQAQTRAKQATLGISAARKQAAKDLQDYQDKLRGGALDEEGAVLDLERARAALARVNLDPNATSYERRQADLAHREAMFRLDEIRKSNKTLRQEAATASKKGIEGSDVVVAAKQEEQDATEAVVEAQDSLNDTYKDNKNAIRDAKRGVADANDAYKESGERISELKENLAELKKGTDDTAMAAQGAAVQTQEYEDALAKLPPQARLVVEELIKLKSWWDKVSYSSQEAISPGLLSFLRDLQRHVLPGISDFLIKMAEGTGEWFRNLGKLLSKRRSLENLSDIFEDAYDLMTLLGEATLNVVEWLLGMGAAAKKSGLTRYIGEVIKSWTDGWKKLVNTPKGVENMAKSMETSMEFATLWGQAISETWGFLRKFFQGFRPLGKWMVENIRDTTKAWSEFLDSPDGANKLKVWQELAVINLQGVSDFIRVLTDQGKKLFDGLDFQKVWDAINGTNKNNGLLNAIGDILGIVDESMIVVVIEFATAILNILKQIGESGAMAAVILLVDTFKGLADTASIIMKSFPILANAVALLIAAFSAKKLLVAIGSLSDLKRILEAMNRSKINGNSVLAEFMGFGNLSKQTKPISFATGGKGSSDYGVSVGASGAGTQLPPGYFDSKSSRQKTSKTQDTRSKNAPKTRTVVANPLFNADAVQKDTGKLQKAAQSYEKSVGKVRGAWANVGTTLKTVVKGTGILLAVSLGIDLLTKLFDWATGTTVEVDNLRLAMEKSWQLKNFEDLDKVFEGSLYKSEGLAGALGLVAQASEDAAMAQKTGSTIWNKATRWISGYTNTVDKTKDSLAQMGDQLAAIPLDQAQGQFRLLADEMANQGIATDDAVGLWGEYKTKIEEAFLAAGIATYTNEDLLLAMQGLHPEQDKLNKVLDKGAEFQEELNEQVETAEEKFRRTTEEISSQEDAIKSWNEAVDDAYGKARDLAEAEDDLARAQKDVNDRIKKMPDAKRILEGNSTAALDNRDMLRDLAKEYETVIQSMIDAGAAPEEIAAKQAEFQKKFEGTISLFDTGKKSVQDMATEMLLFPSQVNANIVVATPNLPPKDVKKLNDILRGLPPNVSSEIALDGMANGLDSAEKLRKKLVALNDIEVTIPIGFGSDRKIVTFDSKDGKASQIYFPKSGLTMKADGGLIRGPGTNTSDSIPALLSDEEYVIRARSAKRLGTRTLDFINKTGQVPKFARGGSVRVRKLAKGGSAGSGGGLGPFFSQFGHIGNAFTSLGSGIGTWGSGFSSWWSRLWGAMNSIMSTQGTNLTTKMRTLNDNTSSLMGSKWKNTWEGAKDTSNRILRGIVDGVSNTSPSMRDAWTKFMSQMRSPISRGVSFVDSTLGKMVNKVAGFYGGKKTPFPLNIKIPGFDTGGWTGPGSRLQPAGIVHADEFVVKKSSRRKIEKQNPGLLDHLNRTGQVPGYAKGGRVLLQGKTFTPRFAQSLTNAAKMAGEWFHITQGGFRPRTSYSGTSHQGDAVDITPVKQKYVTALRKAGIAAWDRTGKGNWIPHIHGVPLPGYGSAAGSAIWQAQSYLRGGDGLGGRDNAPRQTPITGVLKGAKNILKYVGSGVASAFDFAKDLVGGFTSKLKEYFTGTQNKSPWEGVVGSVVNKVSGETSSKVSSWDSGFAGGGHTGDGPKHRVAGIVHKDEFVIKKSSRKKIERLAPGLLDYLNKNGSLPGYASGGKVSTSKTTKTLPSEYSDFTLFLSYLKEADSRRKKTQNDTKEDKTWKHIKGFEWLLYYEGLLSNSAVNGVWGDATTTAYKAWEKANKSTANGKLDDGNVTALAKKYKAKVNTSDPYTKYYSQPTSADYVVAAKMADNAKVSQFKGYLSTIKDKWKHPLVYDALSYIGWDGIPDTYSGVKNAPNALAVAKAMAGDKNKSAAYEAALKKHAPKPEPEDTIEGYDPEPEDKEAEAADIPKGKPSSITDLITSIEENNKQKTKFYGYLNQLRAQGFTLTYDELDKLGPNGIPDVFRDAVDPMSGIQIAEKLSNDKASAERYEEALKNAAKFEPSADALTSKLEEMNALIEYGPGSPYGLNTLAKELGISIDTAVSLFDKLNARGSFKNLSAEKTSRLRTDVAGFKNLFKFSKGGIVPGVGNTDSVFAMLTPGELVIPKDVVNSIFAPGVNAVSPPVTMSKMSSKASSKTESTGNTYNFNTIINNPVSEESSFSIQKRVRNLAHLGMFGE